MSRERVGRKGLEARTPGAGGEWGSEALTPRSLTAGIRELPCVPWVGAKGSDGPALILDPLLPSVATASDPAGPSYAAATLQASSAVSSASPASRTVGSTSKVRWDFGEVEEEKRSQRPQLMSLPLSLRNPPRGRGGWI